MLNPLHGGAKEVGVSVLRTQQYLFFRSNRKTKALKTCMVEAKENLTKKEKKKHKRLGTRHLVCHQHSGL